MAVEITRAGAERLDELEPLWRAMHSHHAAMAAEVAPARPFEESWRRRRAEYENWLAAGEAQLLIAEQDRRVVGYLMLRSTGSASTWDIGERVAEIESLSVLEEQRGDGIGAALMDAARKHADGARLLVSVVHANRGALRFYEREGFGPFYVLLLEK
jgi:ribosomal protein S18 acetylase RimI-like enzyme